MAYQRTETEDTVNTINKSRYISSASSFDKSINIEQPKSIDVIKDSPSLSGMSGPLESVMTETPDKQRIPRKTKIKTSENLIKGKETTQEPGNPSKTSKEDSIPDEEKP